MKVALIGYGKMGKTIEGLLQAEDEVVLRISEDNLADFTIANLRKADVAIEFTQPDSAVSNILQCFEAAVPVVVGTTAWLQHLPEVKAKCAALNGSLFYAPNFSIGVNLFFEVNRKLGQLMNAQPQYEVSLEEIHHTEKKDAPSGTAVKTAEVILEELKRRKGWQLAEGKVAADHIPVVAKREPNVPGTHVVTYRSAVDFIELKHEAVSRQGFAEGAIAAARWLIGRKGVFEMKDLLGLGL